VFWVISVYFTIRNTLPKSGTFFLGHPVYSVDAFILKQVELLLLFKSLKKFEVERYREEKHQDQQARMLVKQMRELRQIEERAAQAQILRKAFR
jgi:hypothetical protein